MSTPFPKIVRDFQKKELLKAHLAKGVEKAVEIADKAQHLKAALEGAAAELAISPKLFKFLGRLYDEGDESTKLELADVQEKLDAIMQLKKKEVL